MTMTNPKIDTFSSQISVDYVGNTKAFATLEGTRTHHLITGDGERVNHPAR